MASPQSKSSHYALKKYFFRSLTSKQEISNTKIQTF